MPRIDGSSDEIDPIIHEPTRLKIVSLLYVVESADFTFIVQQLGLTWGNLSSHLARLEAAQYVEIEKEFVDKKPRTTARLTERGNSAFREYRKKMRTLLEGRPK